MEWKDQMERGREERVWEGIQGGSAKGHLRGHKETYHIRSFLTNKQKCEKSKYNHKIMERQRPTGHLLIPPVLEGPHENLQTTQTIAKATDCSP